MNNLLRNVAVLGAIFAGAASLWAVEPYPLPDVVASVSPEQGLVDISNNASPIGVKQISVTFNGTVAVNPDADGVISLYVDGSEVPSASLPASDAYIDSMGFPAGGFEFEGSWNAAGIYLVDIPEGVWLVDGALSPAMKLNYEIDRPYTVKPVPGVVDEITAVDFVFPDAEKVEVDGEVMMFTMYQDYIATAAVVEDENGVSNTIRVSFADGNGPLESITEAGTYTLMVPKGAFRYTAMRGGELVERSNFEIVYLYYITPMPKPEIEPAEHSTLKAFGTFGLTMPEGFSLSFADTMGFSYIYYADQFGNISSEYAARVKAKNENGSLSLYTLDASGSETDGLAVADGYYALQLAPSLINGFWEDSFITSAPYTYYYRISSDTGVGDVAGEASADSFTVYGFNGVLIGTGMDFAAVKALPRGFYIVNGRKMLVK